MNTFNIEYIGDVPHQTTLMRQEHIRNRVYNGVRIDCVMEHPPTITLGKRGGTIFHVPNGRPVQLIVEALPWHGPWPTDIVPIIQFEPIWIGVRSLACILETRPSIHFSISGINGTIKSVPSRSGSMILVQVSSETFEKDQHSWSCAQHSQWVRWFSFH